MSVAEGLGAGLDLDTRKMVLETIREYGVKNFPHSKLIELDTENHFPTKEMTDLYDPEQIACNLIMIPEKYGGLGGNSYDIYRACELLSKIDLGVCTSVFATFLGMDPIMMGGTEEQKEKWIKKIAQDRCYVAYGATEAAAGYLRVKTPHIAKESMYLKSGHLPYYQDSMFPPMEFDGVKYFLKAMNCPHHHKIFGSQLRSYRDLPVRLAEYGTCYRYEQSGELFGLMRVRSMQMNDAHIYCSLEQFEEEFLAVCRMYTEYFRVFGIEKYQMRLSLSAPEGMGKKYVAEPELWKKTEDMVASALKNGKVEYVAVPNEAAFYGPKIDVQVWSAIGKEFTLATNQVDFAVPKRFDLTYRAKDGSSQTPLCIHRAPLGTHERFIGFLLEHYAGAFPLWLAPVQVKILTIKAETAEPAGRLAGALRAAGLRVELDLRDEKVGAKVRDATLEKVPYMVVLGPKDVAAGALSVRLRDGRQVSGVKEEEFLAKLKLEISEKKGVPSW